jgi:hypothetical protein
MGESFLRPPSRGLVEVVFMLGVEDFDGVDEIDAVTGLVNERRACMVLGHSGSCFQDE